jgi:hypothetical protein
MACSSFAVAGAFWFGKAPDSLRLDPKRLVVMRLQVKPLPSSHPQGSDQLEPQSLLQHDTDLLADWTTRLLSPDCLGQFGGP